MNQGSLVVVNESVHFDSVALKLFQSLLWPLLRHIPFAHMSLGKTIYFIRHGQSEHNVYEEAHSHEPDYHDPNLFDARFVPFCPPCSPFSASADLFSLLVCSPMESLSGLGEIQVKELPKSVEEFAETVELVVVSPLSRAINTCLGAFSPEKVRQRGRKSAESRENEGRKLTFDGCAQVKVLVNCSCREQVSNACDIGSSRSSLMEAYPHLDFSLVANDVWWYLDEEARTTVTAQNYKEEWVRRRYEEPHGTQRPARIHSDTHVQLSLLIEARKRLEKTRQNFTTSSRTLTRLFREALTRKNDVCTKFYILGSMHRGASYSHRRIQKMARCSSRVNHCRRWTLQLLQILPWHVREAQELRSSQAPHVTRFFAFLAALQSSYLVLPL